MRAQAGRPHAAVQPGSSAWHAGGCGRVGHLFQGLHPWPASLQGQSRCMVLCLALLVCDTFRHGCRCIPALMGATAMEALGPAATLDRGHAMAAPGGSGAARRPRLLFGAGRGGPGGVAKRRPPAVAAAGARHHANRSFDIGDSLQPPSGSSGSTVTLRCAAGLADVRTQRLGDGQGGGGGGGGDALMDFASQPQVGWRLEVARFGCSVPARSVRKMPGRAHNRWALWRHKAGMAH